MRHAHTALGLGLGLDRIEVPADAQRISIVGTEFEFAPKDLTVTSEHPVAITFENDGTTDHDWTIHSTDGSEIAHVHATAGQSTLLVANLKPGAYEVWCTVAGHRQAGMVGNLKVT